MKVRIAGVGAAVPEAVIPTAKLLSIFPGPRKKPWTADEFVAKTGIRERRFSVDLDENSGMPIFPPGYGVAPGPAGTLAEEAIREALDSAGLDPGDLDALIFGSNTPDTLHFGTDAQHLHYRLGMRPDASALHVDLGCGGSVFALQWAKEMILSGARRHVAVVLTQVVSPLLNRLTYAGSLDYGGNDNEAFLTALLFGDGAGAAILTRTDDDSESELVSAVTLNEYFEIAVQRAGGNLRPPGFPGLNPSDFAVHIIGKRVADAYAPVLERVIGQALSEAGMGTGDIAKFYLHQSNRRLIEQLADDLGAEGARVPINVDRYGNTSGASVLILLAEEVRAGAVALGSGEPVVIAAVGANLQYGAHVVRL
ncbi:3-oxoacyl-ACP synthase III family protein [Nocardia tengchongensis]|uniref:3-oxoacyl-ACP synthase III family protein n=1 Tax=Nocardia tengchongensis TaxID=2055889 RepID=UPI0036C84B89